MLLVVAVTAVLVEGIVRDPLDWRVLSTVVCIVPAVSLLWRRTHPLWMVSVGFGAVAVIDIATLAGLIDITLFYSLVYIIVLAYALFRWGSGYEAAIGFVVILSTNVLSELAYYSGLTDSILSFGFALLPAAVGASVRFRVNSQTAQLHQLRLREREQLARELHDTVAHHVSAIAVQAQAGQALAASQPEIAVEVLSVVEDAASRALEEMRLMVGALRDGEDPALAPQRGIEDIPRLVEETESTLPIDIQMSGNLQDLQPVVGAAIYRLAQESITNALRHAQDASYVRVSVVGDDDTVRLAVRDDGDVSGVSRSMMGFGLVGMTERAALLGGTFEAGPDVDRGWTVTASVPKSGVLA